MHGLLLGVITPDNTPHGANLTFLLPDIGFIVIAAALFLRFRRPHRVPGHAGLAPARPQPAPAGSQAGTAAPAAQTGEAMPAGDHAAGDSAAGDQAAGDQAASDQAAGQPERGAGGDPEAAGP